MSRKQLSELIGRWARSLAGEFRLELEIRSAKR